MGPMGFGGKREANERTDDMRIKKKAALMSMVTTAGLTADDCLFLVFCGSAALLPLLVHVHGDGGWKRRRVESRASAMAAPSLVAL